MKKLLSFFFSVIVLLSKSQTNDSISLDTLIIKDTVRFESSNFESFKKRAAFENKPYIIMFTASWCAPCHRIKEEIFTHPKIINLLNQNYLTYMLDIEDFDAMEVNSKYFNVSQLPTILFFDPKGRQVDKAIGYFDGYYFFKKIRNQIPPYKRGPDWLEGE